MYLPRRCHRLDAAPGVACRGAPVHARRDARPGRVQGDRGPCGRRGAAHPGDAGVDVVTDGEMRRDIFFDQFVSGMDGFSPVQAYTVQFHESGNDATSRWSSRSVLGHRPPQGPRVPAARRVPRREGPHRQAAEGDDAEPHARRRLLEQRAVAGGLRRSVRALRRRSRAAAGLGRGALRGRLPLRAGRRAGVQRGLRRRTHPRGVRGARDRHRALQVRGRRAARAPRERAAARGLRLRPARLQGQRHAVVHRPAAATRTSRARSSSARTTSTCSSWSTTTSGQGRSSRCATCPTTRASSSAWCRRSGKPSRTPTSSSAGSTRRRSSIPRRTSAWRRSAGSPRRARPPSSG